MFNLPSLDSLRLRALKLSRVVVGLRWTSLRITVCSVLIFLVFAPVGFTQVFEARKQSDRVDLLQDGKIATSYVFKSGSKPILWPLIGPDDARMSREYPMDPDSQNEEHDHPHHRSLWMTYGEVNDFDFWAEGKDKGNVIHTEVVETTQSGTQASVRAKHIWQPATIGNTPAVPLLEGECIYTISGTFEERYIDCEYTLKHAAKAPKAPIHFGDTKEGMFAIRVPESMRADKASGQILNSTGLRNADTWAQPADWVDYSGKATPEAANDSGIAILIHPSSFGRNGYWHVRTYGLFAHNPFGSRHFIEGRYKATIRESYGGLSLEPGRSLHFFYRVVLHRDSWTIEQGNKRFVQFCNTAPLMK